MKKDRISIYDEGETDGTTAGTKLIDCKVESVAGTSDEPGFCSAYGIYVCNERKYLLDSSDGKVTTVDVKSFDGNTKSAYGIYADDWQSYGFELKSANINVDGSDDAVNYGIYTDDSAPWTLEDMTVDVTGGDETIRVTYEKGIRGTGLSRFERHDVGSAFNLEDAVFTRIGYTMDGWALSDGGVKEYDLEESVSFDEDVVLYPAWKINKSVEPDDPSGSSSSLSSSSSSSSSSGTSSSSTSSSSSSSSSGTSSSSTSSSSSSSSSSTSSSSTSSSSSSSSSSAKQDTSSSSDKKGDTSSSDQKDDSSSSGKNSEDEKGLT